MSQPAPPQYSPDGRFYWDGQRWQPMPQAKAATSRISGVLVLTGAAAVVIGTFLPWMEASAPFVGTITRDLISSPDGEILAGIGAVGGLLGLLLLLRGPGIVAGALALLVAAGAGYVLTFDYQEVSQTVSGVTGGSVPVIAHVGPGPYLSGLGLVVWILGGLVGLFGRRPKHAWRRTESNPAPEAPLKQMP
jgi:hypothetical protein